MRLWRLEYGWDDKDLRRPMVGVKWCGTQADAKATYKELMDAEGVYDISKPEPVDIPTDKEGLLEWLNMNAAGDDTP